MPQQTTPASSAIEIEEKFVVIAGSRLRYLAGGSGPAVVFLHGLLGYSFSWRFNLPAFAEKASVYALDLPGVGFSEPLLGTDCSFPRLAAVIVDFLEALKIDSVTLVGSSHGGAIAMLAAALAQRRGISVEKLVLVSPVNPWSNNGWLLTSALGSPIGAGCFLPVAPALNPLHGFFVRRMYGDTKLVTRDTVNGYSISIRRPGTIAQLLLRIRNWRRDRYALRDSLPELSKIPTLLVWGGRDRAVSLSSAKHLLKVFERARLVVMDQAGHLPYEEQPPEFNEIALQFLASGT